MSSLDVIYIFICLTNNENEILKPKKKKKIEADLNIYERTANKGSENLEFLINA